jgi:hypothetical protein
MTDAEAQKVATAGLLGQRQRGLRRRDGMPRVDRQYAHAEPHARRDRAVGGENEERIPPAAVRDPHAVVAELVGAPGEVDAGREIATGREEGRGLHARAVSP